VLVRMQRKTNLLALLVGIQTGAAILESRMEVPQKVKNRSTQSLYSNLIANRS